MPQDKDKPTDQAIAWTMFAAGALLRHNPDEACKVADRMLEELLVRFPDLNQHDQATEMTPE